MSDLVARLNAALGGRYAIERELGEGGMATVYLAEDIKHERKGALKVRLRGPLPGPRWRLRARALRGNPLRTVAFFPTRSGTGPQRCSVAHRCGPAAPQFTLTTKSCEREGMTHGSAITSRAIVMGATSR